MDANHKKVLEESRLFRAKLPQLLPKYEGRWVIFLNNAVQGDFEEQEEAYATAVRRFGVRGGFVIAQVTPDAAEPVAMSAVALLLCPS